MVSEKQLGAEADLAVFEIDSEADYIFALNRWGRRHWAGFKGHVLDYEAPAADVDALHITDDGRSEHIDFIGWDTECTL